MPDTTDPAVSALDEIRERSTAALEFPLSGFAEDSIRACTQSAMDVPRLLKVVEDALALHQPVTTNGGWLEGREWQECGECGPNNGQENVYAAPGAGEEFWPCPTVRAITAALTEGEGGNG